MRYTYLLTTWLYLAVPVISICMIALIARRQRRTHPVHMLIRACTIGAFLGGTVAFLYMSLASATIPVSQIALAAYLGMSALCVVYGVNWLLWHVVSRLFRINAKTGRGGGPLVQIAAGIVQATLLVIVGLPYLGSLLVLYRPKAPTSGDPQSLVAAAYETVAFDA